MRSSHSFRIGLAFALIALAGQVPLALAAGADDRPLPPAQNIAVGLDDSLARAQGMFPLAKVVDSRITRHRGKWVNQVQLFRGTTLRTLKIDLATGQVLAKTQVNATGQRLSNLRSTVRLLNTVATSRAEAIQAAEAAVPGAKVYEVELDDFNDQRVFKVKLLDGGTPPRRVTVLVAASTGKVIPVAGDGVMNLSIDDAAASATRLFPAWTLLKIEIDDDRGFDDSGQHYNLRLVNEAGNQRRDVKLHANSGVVLRDRTNAVNGGNVSEFAAIAAAAAPAVSFGKAGMFAAESIAGSRVHEVQLKLEGSTLVYEVEVDKTDGTRAKIKINAATGLVVSGGTNPPTGGGAGITSSQAAAIALARVPGATVREITTDTEEGVAVYEVKLNTPGGGRTDVKVSIATGEIIRVDVKD